jgi:hypothetical protein
MKEGYWLNYRTGKEFEIDEHERWLRAPGNARKLGVPPNVIIMFNNFRPEKDRDKFLLFVMKSAPVIRARGHGSHMTFEYASRDRQSPMDSVWMLAKQHAGLFTQLDIVNFATGESTQVSFQDFESAMDSGGADAVMRVAGARRFEVKGCIARELLEISKELLR